MIIISLAKSGSGINSIIKVIACAKSNIIMVIHPRSWTLRRNTKFTANLGVYH